MPFCCLIADTTHLCLVNSRTKPFLSLPVALQHSVSHIPVILAIQVAVLYRCMSMLSLLRQSFESAA